MSFEWIQYSRFKVTDNVNHSFGFTWYLVSYLFSRGSLTRVKYQNFHMYKMSIISCTAVAPRAHVSYFSGIRRIIRNVLRDLFCLRFCHRPDGRHGFEKNISSCTVSSYTALPMKTEMHFQPTLSKLQNFQQTSIQLFFVFLKTLRNCVAST